MKKSLKLATTVALVASALSGCSSLSPVSVTSERAYDKAESKLQSDIEKLKTGDAYKLKRITKTPFIAKNTSSKAQTKNLPSFFDEKVYLDINANSFNELSAKFYESVKIPMRFDSRVSDESSKDSNNRGSADSSNFSAKNTTESDVALFKSKTANLASKEVRFTADGTLRDALNAFTSKYGLFWKYQDGSIVLFSVETRTFNVKLGTKDYDSTASVKAGSEDSAGSATFSKGGKFKPWDDIVSSVRGIVAKSGTVVPSPNLGSLTVTASPIVLAEVEKYIDNQNVALNKKVSVTLGVYILNKDKSDTTAVDFEALYKQLSGKYNLNIASGAGGAVLDSLTGTNQATLTWANGRFAGSSAIANALATQSKSVTEYSGTAVISNRRTSPIVVGNEQNYAKSVETTKTSDTVSSSISTGTLKLGFSTLMTPIVSDNNRIELDASIDVRSLIKMTTFSSGSASSQNPDVKKFNFDQTVSLIPGQTYMTAGFVQDKKDNKEAGTFTSWFTALGGGFSATQNKEVILITITANIVE